MAKITHGSVTLTFDDALTPPPDAGKLSQLEVQRLPKAPAGIGLAAELTSTALLTAGAAFTPPQGITAKSLLAAGQRADGYDGLLAALDVIRQEVAQANLLADAECWNQLRQVNDMLKGQVKHHPELAVMFAPLTAFMSRSVPTTKHDPTGSTPSA